MVRLIPWQARRDCAGRAGGMLPRWRAPYFGVIAVGGLLAALLAIGAPAASSSAMSAFGVSVASRTTGDDRFYLPANPPGVVVSLDGRTLTYVPTPADTRPLTLTPGHHTLSWTSRLYRFVPLKCSISVPRATTDTCPNVSKDEAAGLFAEGTGTIIGVHESLAALTPADGAALTFAVASALDAAQFTTTVLPGESYFAGYGTGPATGALVAETPLRATIRFQYVPTSEYGEPCAADPAAIPCRFPGQDCAQLCTIANPPPAVAPPHAWIAAALVRATWDYTGLDGTPVATGITDAFGLQLAALRITYDASGWHVSTLIGYVPGLDVANDAVCDTTRFLLDQTHAWRTLVETASSPAAVTLAALPNPADGCVAVLAPLSSSSGRAILLGRVGVLRTVSALAASPADALPEADVPELQLATQGLAQLQP